jgi:hypothetical protein
VEFFKGILVKTTRVLSAEKKEYHMVEDIPAQAQYGDVVEGPFDHDNLYLLCLIRVPPLSTSKGCFRDRFHHYPVIASGCGNQSNDNKCC